MKYLPLIFFLSGCPSPGLHTGLSTVQSQEGFTLNTAQKCLHAADTTRIADRVLMLSLHYLTNSGHIKSYHEAVKRTQSSSMAVCLVDKPEKCAFGGWIHGPFGPKLKDQKYPLAARKRGCASPWHAWSSICWPPICTKDWPDEPHCVKPGEASSKGWEDAFIHEVFNMARAKWTDAQTADYSKLPGLFAPGGVKSKMVAAYKAADYHDWPVFLPAVCK